jgi:hypothetical protein
MAQYYHFCSFGVRQNNASLLPSETKSETAEIKIDKFNSYGYQNGVRLAKLQS